MKIYDMHVHADRGVASSDKLIEKMQEAGVWGGCIFSQSPMSGGEVQENYKQRLSNVLQWTKGYQGRLFPALWIHPREKNIIQKIRDAVNEGVYAFKMICEDYYVYDAQVIEILNEISELKKPVFFHSGILWNGAVSSIYNKPINWEGLIHVAGLRFSMGHCSWPWHDECIALYGKFMNAHLENPKVSCEMFFDLTPGTPEIYREQLLYKLFNVGYDVPRNILFGTDSSTSTYGGQWVENWISLDNRLYEKLGIPMQIRQKIYEENFLRFIGQRQKDFTHRLQSPDSGIAWRISDGV